MNLQEHTRMSENLMKAMSSELEAELIQTHISTIILSADLVYKLKKPVDFGFLDYSTLEKRHKYCLEEMRINEGYAPKLYMGVVPITGTIEDPRIDGEEKVLDYAVKMRRFEQRDQLDNIVEEEGLEIELMDKIAALVARSHEGTAPVDAASDYGEPKRVLLPMVENFDLLQFIAHEHALDLELSSVIAWTNEQFERLKPLLQQRKEKGFVRECHGDMHLHNMALHEGELILFDAIEFNPYLNHIDVISDLSFLLMDLEYRGLIRHSHRLMNHYLELTGDYEAVVLLDFYKTYRAMVRAKVAALRIGQEMEADKRTVLMDEVLRYIDLAKNYCERKEPFLAIAHGLSGSGKSTFALMMVEEHGVVRIRSDVERMRMFEREKEDTLEEGIYTQDATKATYEHLLELATSVYKGGYPVIVDATFLKQWQRQIFFKYARLANIPFYLFTMACDIKLMQSRVEQRSQEGSDISEADLGVLQMQQKSVEPLSESERELEVIIDCTSSASMSESASKIEKRSLC
ncbi:MAG: aminoglycoside phosphotransferase [Epsilonproteobacteria bacterium]|nr:MAG: aminoglycoside phosphotransferase [Campylobacterota bacterium]